MNNSKKTPAFYDLFIQFNILALFLGLVTSVSFKIFWDTTLISLQMFQDYDLWLFLTGLILLLAVYFSPIQIGASFFEIFNKTNTIAVFLFAFLIFGHFAFYKSHPLSIDEYCFSFQSKIFASGQSRGFWPFELHQYFLGKDVLHHFFVSLKDGSLICRYWPGYSILRAPFQYLNIAWVLNPLLAVGCIYIVKYLCTKLFPRENDAAAWGTLFLVASPSFLINAFSFYPNTFYVFSALAYSALLYHPTRFRIILAGVLGSFAMVQHAPMPHGLFALPWFFWLYQQDHGLRKILLLAAAYLPIALFIGFGWFIWFLDLGALTQMGAPAISIWDYVIRETMDKKPFFYILIMRYMGLLKLFIWTAPCVVILSVLGFHNAPKKSFVRTYGYSIICIFVGYIFVPGDSGHGWGFRYFEGAWGGLIILAVSMISYIRKHLKDAIPIEQKIKTLSFFGLFFIVPLIFSQVEFHQSSHLKLVPQFSDDNHIEILFIDPTAERDRRFQTDMIQNDPYLKSSKIIFYGTNPAENQKLMQRKFPNFRSHTNKKNLYTLPTEASNSPEKLSPFEKKLIRQIHFTSTLE